MGILFTYRIRFFIKVQLVSSFVFSHKDIDREVQNLSFILAKLVEEVNKVLVMDMVMEGLVDKEVAKLMEKVNKVMVMDMVLEGVVDNR